MSENTMVPASYVLTGRNLQDWIYGKHHPSKRVVWQTTEGLTLQADIDVEIAPLILKLWQRGYKTRECCQDCKGYVWIMFEAFKDAISFFLTVSPTVSQILWQNGRNGGATYDGSYGVHFPRQELNDVIGLFSETQ